MAHEGGTKKAAQLAVTEIGLLPAVVRYNTMQLKITQGESYAYSTCFGA